MVHRAPINLEELRKYAFEASRRGEITTNSRNPFRFQTAYRFKLKCDLGRPQLDGAQTASQPIEKSIEPRKHKYVARTKY